MVTIETSIIIAASTQTVWEVLLDLESYADWNPYVVKASGVPEVGGRIEVLISPPGAKKPAKFKPKVLVLDAPKRFEWKGGLAIPGLFSGHHCFELIAKNEATEFRQWEHFGGLMSGMMRGKFGATTKQGFEALNQALADEVKRRSA